MSDHVYNHDEQLFIRAYNGRRRQARFSLYTVCGLGIVALIYRHFKLPDEKVWITIAFLFLIQGYLNWVRGNCPKCGRFIGYSRWANEGVPRGLRCDLEIACKDALDQP